MRESFDPNVYMGSTGRYMEQIEGLTKTERKLLVFLMSREGKPTTKSMMNIELFGIDLNSRGPEVYIGYLRRKLGKNIIENKRGFGWMYINELSRGRGHN